MSIENELTGYRYPELLELVKELEKWRDTCVLCEGKVRSLIDKEVVISGGDFMLVGVGVSLAIYREVALRFFGIHTHVCQMRTNQPSSSD